MTPETKIKNTYLAVVADYKARGIMFDRPYVPGVYGERGWPDRDGCVRAGDKAVPFYIEFKTPMSGKTLTGLQAIRRAQILGAGAAHFTIYDETSLAEFLTWLKAQIEQ